jgi:nucleoside phosphorylase
MTEPKTSAGALIDQYIALWHIEDETERAQAVEALFSPDVHHETPVATYDGLEALQARIRKAHETWIGTGENRFVSAGDQAAQHSTVKFHWHMVRLEDQAVVTGGFEFLVLDDSGRIAADYQYLDA